MQVLFENLLGAGFNVFIFKPELKYNRYNNIILFSGMLYKYYNSYVIAFFCAGCPPIIGSIMMCGIYFTKSQNKLAGDEENGENYQLKNSLT